ncbi:XdhC family protein [soil metagenome]
MREVLDTLVQRLARGESVTVATVVRTFASAPRPVGASMLRLADGAAVGSVSGGCVEGAVYERAAEVAATGRPGLERYGVSDDDAFAVGLACGGILDVFIETVTARSFPELDALTEAIDVGRPAVLVTVIAHPDPAWVGRHLVVHEDHLNGTTGSDRADEAIADDVRGLLASGDNGTITYGPDGQRRGEDLEIFATTFAPKPRMIVFGAIDFAAAVAHQGAFLGYHVTVCDARPVFATTARFPEADEVVTDWPHRYLAAQDAAGRIDAHTVICVLTHDPKFDVPLLEVALRLTEVGYIGAMGSRRTHDDRVERLRAAGVTDTDIARMSSPIGLDIGGRTPQETAVSIAAEIVASRWGGTGRSLKDVGGRVHRDASVRERA